VVGTTSARGFRSPPRCVMAPEDQDAVETGKFRSLQRAATRDLLVRTSARANRNLWIAVLLIVVVSIAVGISSTAVIFTRKVGVSSYADPSRTAALTSSNNELLSTAGTRRSLKLGPIADPTVLNDVQQLHLNMEGGEIHVFQVTGLSYYNATDVDFYTSIGQTVHVAGDKMWLAPTTFGSPPDRARRLQLCAGICDAVIGGLIVAGVSHYLGWG